MKFLTKIVWDWGTVKNVEHRNFWSDHDLVNQPSSVGRAVKCRPTFAQRCSAGLNVNVRVWWSKEGGRPMSNSGV